MFCSNCGTKMSDDAAFCPECGTPVRQGNGGNPQQTVNQNIYQAPIQSRKEIPAAGSKKAKIIIAVSGFLTFLSMFLSYIVGSLSIYQRYKTMQEEKIFWIACVFILLVVVLNVLNLQKWSLIGSLGMLVFVLGQFIETFQLRRIMGRPSMGIGFWLFLGSSIVCLAVAVKEAILDFFEKYRQPDENVGLSQSYAQSQTQSQAYTQHHTQSQASRPTVQKPKKGLKIGGIVLMVLGALAILGGFVSGDYRRIMYIGIEFPDLVTIGMEIGMIVGGIIMIIKSRNGKY